MTHTREWTPAEVATMRKLQAEGVSYAGIGRQLHRTKNSVVSKAHRLGCPARPSPIKPAKPKPPASPPQPIQASEWAMPPATASSASQRPGIGYVPPCLPITGLTRARTCQWPSGDPRQGTYRLCGATPVVLGRPYCAGCCALAYVPAGRGPGEPEERPEAAWELGA